MARGQYQGYNITVDYYIHVCLMISAVIYQAFIQALLSTAVFPQRLNFLQSA